MEELSIEEQMRRLLRSCRWAAVVDGLPISRAKRYLQRSFYSASTLLGMDLRRSNDGAYLIKAEGRYQVVELEDWEMCIRELAFISGLENYAITKEIIEFVLEKTYSRKEVV